MENLSGGRVYREAFWVGLAPDTEVTVSEWADKYRILSTTSAAEPGQWRTSRTPYLKEIMDCFSPMSNIEEVVVMKGAQIGYSEALVNIICFTIDVTSGPLLMVQPTVDLAKRFSKQRIDPAIEFCERLKDKVSDPRSRDSGNTMLAKEFPGGIAVLTGANSAVGLRSMPARLLLMDELDGMGNDVEGEGDPVLLAKARTRTFARRKICLGGTPTFDGTSKTAAAFAETDQRRYFVPCPHCMEFQTIEWPRIKWPKGEPDKAALVCEHCEKSIPEYHKTKMLEQGQWRPTNPEAKNKRQAGFHISSLYSPVGWFSWADAAKLWERASTSPEMLRGFVNTVLGETWKERGDAPDWKRLYDRREPYQIGVVPREGLLLVAGCDVQKDRIEAEIVAYGRGKESWSVDYRVLYGDTSVPETGAWLKLDDLLNEQFPHEGGCLMPIRKLGIDSGFNTQAVYNWARKYGQDRVMATKGRDTMPVMLGPGAAVDVTVRGRTLSKGFKVFTIGVNLLKTELYGWLQLERPVEGGTFPPGYCHFPEYGEEYFKQITAEHIVSKQVRGYKKSTWEKTRDRNEALDCRVIARVVANSLGIDRMRPEHWSSLAGALGVSDPTPPPPATVTNQPPGANNAPRAPQVRQRRKVDYL